MGETIQKDGYDALFFVQREVTRTTLYIQRSNNDDDDEGQYEGKYVSCQRSTNDEIKTKAARYKRSNKDDDNDNGNETSDPGKNVCYQRWSNENDEEAEQRGNDDYDDDDDEKETNQTNDRGYAFTTTNN